MNNKYIKLILTCITLIFCQITSIYPQDEKELSPNKLLKDFDNIQKIIEAHPDPYTHISEKDFNAKIEKY